MARHKKIIGIMFVFLILVFGVLFFVDANESNWCIKGTAEYRDCVSLVGNIIEPFFWSFLPLLPVTLILFFLRREVFVAWAKFAAVGFPLILGLMLYAFNVGQTTGGWVGGPTESELASFTLPPLFLIISLAIIGVKWWGLRRQNQKLSG